MKPIEMKVRALRRLAKSAYDSDFRPGMHSVRFRPGDVVVTDGVLLAIVPIERDDERDFGVPATELIQALDGMPRDAGLALLHEDGETRISFEDRAHRVVIKDIGGNLPDITKVTEIPLTTTSTATFGLDGRYVARVGRLARDIGKWIPGRPLTMVASGSCDSLPPEPALFEFAVEHGTARVFVMPVRR